MNHRSTKLLIFLFFFIAGVQQSDAQLLKFLNKKKEPNKEKTTAPKKSKYEKLLTDKKSESKYGTFISLHKSDGKIYLEIPLKNLNKEMMVAGTISSVSNPMLGITGFKNSEPLHIKFAKNDSNIILKKINSDFVIRKSDQSYLSGIKLNYTDINLHSFKIEAFNKDSSAVVIDGSSFFLKDNKHINIINTQADGYKITPSPKEELTYISDIKSFEDNVCIKVEKSYVVNISNSTGRNVLENAPVTVSASYSILDASFPPMTPRLSDTRVGVFQTSKLGLDQNLGNINKINFVNRWRVEPKDTAAFFAGKLSEPIKPIVFYVDTAFPKEMIEPIKKGILRWNKAFEKIGFKNVMQAYDFPKDDPNFDPDNLKYSCIRYIPTTEENAMGPSWVDPRSGEIINASVFLYNNVVKLIQNWRFIQTAQLDSRVRSKVLDRSIFDESLEYVVAHEIGHTLGFMHNMASSAAIPTDSLRSAEFTQKHGTTASIMDYARFNYVAQSTDKGVKLTPPYLGVFDYFLIDWTYRVFPDSQNDFVTEAKKLNEMVEKHAGDPFYRYVMQQIDPQKRFDPSAIEEDLGNDPIKSSDYGFKNLKYILSNMDTWITDDEDSSFKTELYRSASMQAYRYASNVFMNVGGIYINQSSEKSGIPRYKVVNKDTQRKSAMWLLQKARDFESYANPQLERKLYAANKPFSLLADYVQKMAIGGLQRVTVGFYLDSTSYSPLAYCEDVFNNVFDKTIKGNTNLTEQEMALQKNYVSYIKPFTENIGTKSRGLNSDFEQEMEAGFHLLHQHAPCCRYCAQRNASEHDLRSTNHKNTSYATNFGDGYGEPEDIWIQAVNKSSDYLFHYAVKTIKLLEKVEKSTTKEELKMHYAYLLNQLREKRK